MQCKCIASYIMEIMMIEQIIFCQTEFFFGSHKMTLFFQFVKTASLETSLNMWKGPTA